jgi:tRNA threonylcarbamoyl adenosine modification protein YeaZ
MRPHDRTRAAGKIVRFRRRRGLLRAVMNTLLAFDTATERISIALAARGQVWQHDGEGGAKASATFLPAILGLLRDAGVQVTDLDAIAFGRGPGAFTGLRTACSVAQGLAFGSGRPVLPIDTLLALAEDARVGADPVRIWAVMDARMQEIYAARYAWDGQDWSVVDAPMLTTAAKPETRWSIGPTPMRTGPMEKKPIRRRSSCCLWSKTSRVNFWSRRRIVTSRASPPGRFLSLMTGKASCVSGLPARRSALDGILTTTRTSRPRWKP